MRKAIFLDRDGVLVVDKGYQFAWCDVKISVKFLTFLQEFSKAFDHVFIITNQSGVGRGYFTQEDCEQFNKALVAECLSYDVKITNVYACYHTPSDNCQCRKPKPGMILAAARQYGIHLAGSVLFGDKVSDIIAGKNAGIGENYLVNLNDKNFFSLQY
jgi:D-glycero-D-manno-heptose 1,7-bisphosphate phosphatase